MDVIVLFMLLRNTYFNLSSSWSIIALRKPKDSFEELIQEIVHP
jgi:hypothetical protein